MSTSIYTIRPMLPQEANEVATCFARIVENLSYYNEVARREEIRNYSSSRLVEKVAEDPYSVLVAYADTELAGFCFNYVDDYTIWLEWIIVVQNLQHSGIGSGLLNQLTHFSLLRSCHKIWCDCRTTNEISKSFLHKNGFTIIATIPDHWYRQDFVLLQKFIAA